MRFENDFYKTIESRTTESGFDVTVELNAEHQVYAGHFPGQPVVPGVCTLTVIRETLGNALGRDIRFNAIRECKYVGVILPEQGLRIRFVMDIDGDRLKCLAYKGEENVLKLNATFTECKKH